MTSVLELFKSGRVDEIWQRYCGFLDLSLADFMMIQKRLLMEQLELLNKCELGEIIMNGAKPRTMGEFREKVPLTRYENYLPIFSKRRREILPEKPILWMHTSGRSGEYTKWIPVTERRYQEMGNICIAAIIMSACKKKGEVNIRAFDRWLYALAPPPYMTGTWARCVEEVFPITILPPLDEAEKLSFSERTQKGIQMALEGGMDLLGGMPSVLMAIANKLGEGSGKIDFLSLIKKPGTSLRFARGIIKSRLSGRRLYPKDLWKLKGILAGGADTIVYREKIKELYGRYPLDLYAFTEGGIIATQTWTYQGMTFLPSLNFYEFIPEKESIKSQNNPDYRPSTLLLDEVRPGENYELVITNLLGGSMVRYRVGDMIRITSLRDNEAEIDIPQMQFYSRVDNIIDIAGFTRLTEKTIWQAIENAGVENRGWTARKEGIEQPYLHIYIEPVYESVDIKRISENIHKCLTSLDQDYANLESLLGMNPLKVTLLPQGTFQKYADAQQTQGAQLGKLRPPHTNPSDKIINHLISGDGSALIAEVAKKSTNS